MPLTPSVLGGPPGAWDMEGLDIWRVQLSSQIRSPAPVCLFIHNPVILSLPVRYAVVTTIGLYVLNTSYTTQAVLSALPASFLRSRSRQVIVLPSTVHLLLLPLILQVTNSKGPFSEKPSLFPCVDSPSSQPPSGQLCIYLRACVLSLSPTP